MKIQIAIGLFCLFTTGAMAQRGGGHVGGGGARMGGGGYHGGSSGISSFHGGGYGIGVSHYGGVGGAIHYGGYGGGIHYGGYGGYRGWYGRGYYPWYGYGYWPGYWGGYYGYPYGYPSDYYASYNYAYPAVSNYDPSPNVTVVYPPLSRPAYNMYVPPTQGGYDQYGQSTGSTAAAPPAPAGAPMRSPVFLIAFQDHTIRAAESYSVSGNTLHYVTLEHEAKQAPLDSVDRALSQQLNRERRVSFTLPAQ